jgi:hypothetical protein
VNWNAVAQEMVIEVDSCKRGKKSLALEAKISSTKWIVIYGVI